MAFFVDDVFKGLCDFGVHAAQVATFFDFLTTMTDLLHHFSNAFYSISVLVGHSLAHEAPEGRIDISVVHEVVGHLGH